MDFATVCEAHSKIVLKHNALQFDLICYLLSALVDLVSSILSYCLGLW